MTVLPDRLPTRRPDVLIADFDTELVVLVPEQNTAHRLDEGLSLILSSCDGRTTTAELVAEIAGATGDDRTAIETWLSNSLERLAELKILPSNADATAEGSATDEPT